MTKKCFNCGQNGTELYGYVICEACKKDLRLFTDKTIERHVAKFTKQAYKKEIEERLAFIETDVIKKKIKLLDILYKLDH